MYDTTRGGKVLDTRDPAYGVRNLTPGRMDGVPMRGYSATDRGARINGYGVGGTRTGDLNLRADPQLAARVATIPGVSSARVLVNGNTAYIAINNATTGKTITKQSTSNRDAGTLPGTHNVQGPVGTSTTKGAGTPAPIAKPGAMTQGGTYGAGTTPPGAGASYSTGTYPGVVNNGILGGASLAVPYSITTPPLTTINGANSPAVKDRNNIGYGVQNYAGTPSGMSGYGTSGTGTSTNPSSYATPYPGNALTGPGSTNYTAPNTYGTYPQGSTFPGTTYRAPQNGVVSGTGNPGTVGYLRGYADGVSPYGIANNATPKTQAYGTPHTSNGPVNSGSTFSGSTSGARAYGSSPSTSGTAGVAGVGGAKNLTGTHNNTGLYNSSTGAGNVNVWSDHSMTAALRAQIVQTVRQANPSIQNVYVTANPTARTRMEQYLSNAKGATTHAVGNAADLGRNFLNDLRAGFRNMTGTR